MKKISLLAVSASLLLATNGDNLISLGAKSRAMGGVGIATYFGAENSLSNPALISNGKGTELDFGATLFMPNVKAQMKGQDEKKSGADTNVIPEISISQKINDNWTFGIGMFGSAGMGVDYRGDANGLLDARTNLLLMKFAPSLSYNSGNFAVGFAPIMQYGSLDIAYNFGGPVGQGSSDDFGFGYQLGATYNITDAFRIGAKYESAISMNYKNTLSVASQPFVGMGIFPSAFGDDLEQPAVYGLGTSYDFNNFNFSFDYKKIKWSDAKGYKDFGWKDQNVYALGAKYEAGGTWYALGYNYAKNPITNYSGNANTQAAMNLFNYLMFPATEESHYTIGAGTKITKNLSLGTSLVYAPKKTISTSLAGLTAYGMPPSLTVKHSETSISFSIKYNF